MADVKISALPAATILTGTEIPPVVQGGVTSRTTINAIYTYVRGLFSSNPIAITEGGTGAVNAPAARTALSAAVRGTNNDITSLTALTTPITVAQGGTGANNVTSAQNNLGVSPYGVNYISGNVYFLNSPATVSAGVAQTTNGDIVFMPIVITAPVTLKALGTRIFTASAGGNLTIGIYANDPTLNKPTGAVLAQVSGLSTATATVVSGNLASPVSFQPGIYWTATQMDNTTAVLISPTGVVPTGATSIGATSFTLASPSGTISGPVYFTTTGTYPTLPNMTAVTPSATNVVRGGAIYAQVN